METLIQERTKTKRKTVYPVINSVLIEFSLKIDPSQIHDFREAVLSCIPEGDEQEIFSNERRENGVKKTIVRYPVIQFRERNGHAAIWAIQQGVPLLYKFVQEYKSNFRMNGKKFELHLAQLPNEINDFIVKTFRQKNLPLALIYRIYYYIPFINENKNRNYDWYKASRNLPDVEKTKKLEELLISHLCTFIHYAGGHIPREKIKLVILDKKFLGGVNFKGREHPAYEIRYSVNLNLPQFLAIGNKCSHGFGWQWQEKE